MPTQRSGGGPDAGGERTRRAFVAGVGTTLAGTLAGCTGVVGTISGPRPVTILAAGSLQNAFGDGLRAAVTAPLRIEVRGSAAAARMVAAGQRDPDIVALADTALFDAILDAPWYARFATNALAVAYTTETAGGRRVADADRWYAPIVAGAATLGRTDPDLDPLGYRTLFMLALAAERYDRPGLAGAVLDASVVYPETALLSKFETGAVDAAVVYRSMAVDRGYEAIDLPPAIDLSDPGRADAYRRASYTLPDGTVVRGAPIRYGATLRHVRPASRAAFETLVAGDYLSEHGFAVPAAYPRYEGDVPAAVR